MTRIVAFFAAALLLAGCSVAPTQFEVHGKIEPIPQAQPAASTNPPARPPTAPPAPTPEQLEAAKYARQYRASYHLLRLRYGLDYFRAQATMMDPFTAATGEWYYQKAAYLSLPELQADLKALRELTSDAYSLKPKLDMLQTKIDALARDMQIQSEKGKATTDAVAAARDLKLAVWDWKSETLGPSERDPKYAASKEILTQMEDLTQLESMNFIAFVYDSSTRASQENLVKLAQFMSRQGGTVLTNRQLTPEALDAMQSLIAMADDAERRISSGSSHKPLFFARINGAKELHKKRYTDMEAMFPLPAPKS